ncbi:MAG: septal ring lytic transglycosylase RlpA family protein [Halieaceae bacterium]
MRLFGAIYSLAILVGCAGNKPNAADYEPPPVSPATVIEAVPSADPVSRMGNKSPYTVFGKQYTVMSSAKGYSEEGIASWYGMKFQGRLTSNGEVFDVYAATAAHKSLPLPSFVRVTNLENNTSMIVRVNDRGPFVDDRLIDVSYGVAVRLGFAEQGTARVRVDYINVSGTDDWRSTEATTYRRLQLGAYEQRSSAEGLAEAVRELLGSAIPVDVSEVSSDQRTVYRVRLGPVEGADSTKQLDRIQMQLRDNGFPEGQRLP